MRIRIIKDCAYGKVGEVREFGEGVADGLLRRGLAEKVTPGRTKARTSVSKRKATNGTE